MKKIYTFLSLALMASATMAQLTVDTTLSPQQIVEDVFLDNGIFASNITYNYGDASTPNLHFGTFNSANANVGIASGIVMTTGHVNVAVGPNNQSGATLYGGNEDYSSTDPDLQALVPGYTSNDWSVVEFDFIATGDSLAFTYVFGSEEYLEWVGSSFNDHFGFFISGPGITGPYSNAAVNIATIPGTDLAVAINNVNEFTNPEYYVNNGDGMTIPYSEDAYYVQFDGLTTPLVAAIGNLTVGEVYHIKLAIADAGDSILDSGVFLQGDSFVQFCTPEDEVLPGECLLSHLDAQVHYTEDCGVVQLFNYSEINIETTGCHYDMGDGGTTDACTQGITYEYAEPGTYTIKLVYMVDEFTAHFEVASLLISDTPPVQPIIIVDADQLSVTNWDGTSTLQWYLDGVAIDGATSSTLDANSDGYYTVTANNGCPASSDAVFVSSIALHGKPEGLRVYPNPSSGLVRISTAADINSIEVYDVAGRLVFASPAQIKPIELMLNPGAYEVRAVGVTGRTVHTSKLIIQ
ncbi:MAG: T9SS type A sorting domain-containing protein [Flavobacteriales bacterium]|nr:T9SS type A sorting domain-containing protein [Flavobacteriales bacterium]